MKLRFVGCSHLQSACQLDYQAADSVLTSGCSFISHHIWNKICIVLAIRGIGIKIGQLHLGIKIVYIDITGWHACHLGCLGSLIVNGWHRWHSVQCCSQLWCQLSASVWWRCTHWPAPSSCLQILYQATLGMKVTVCWFHKPYLGVFVL